MSVLVMLNARQHMVVSMSVYQKHCYFAKKEKKEKAYMQVWNKHFAKIYEWSNDFMTSLSVKISKIKFCPSYIYWEFIEQRANSVVSMWQLLMSRLMSLCCLKSQLFSFLNWLFDSLPHLADNFLFGHNISSVSHHCMLNRSC